MAISSQVRSLTTAQPFRPFTVKLVDGKVFTVHHPENIAIGLGGRDMVVMDEEGMHLLEAIQVELMEPIAQPGQDGNGD
jgi:hypothetical protein